MIVTRSQYALIRAGRLATIYVPPYVAKPWKPSRSYLGLRIAETLDGERQVRQTDHSVTIIGVGDPKPVRDLVGRVEADPAYWDLVYPEHDGDCVWVAFALGDWRDRPRLLGAGRRGSDDRGYTTVPELAVDPDGECVDDEWLKRFGDAAVPFIQARQADRQARRNTVRNARDLRRDLKRGFRVTKEAQ